MIRALISFFAVIIILSGNASLGDSGLIGLWSAPCNLGNPGGTQYTQTKTEFFANGTVKIEDSVYSNSKCAGPVVRTSPEMNGVYKVVQKSLRMTAVQGHTYEEVANFEINGGVLSLTQIQLFVDGKFYESANDTILTRVR